MKSLFFTLERSMRLTLREKTNLLVLLMTAGFLLTIFSVIFAVKAPLSFPGTDFNSISAAQEAATPGNDEIVIINTSSKIYHKPGCVHASKCTENCMSVKFSKIKGKGYRPCKVCHPSE